MPQELKDSTQKSLRSHWEQIPGSVSGFAATPFCYYSEQRRLKVLTTKTELVPNMDANRVITVHPPYPSFEDWRRQNHRTSASPKVVGKPFRNILRSSLCPAAIEGLNKGTVVFCDGSWGEVSRLAAILQIWQDSSH